MKRQSEASILLEQHLKELFASWQIVPEYKFVHDRKFRFDFAVLKMNMPRIAIEIDGGAWIKGGGRHNRPVGFLKDAEKMNLAMALGWRVFRFSPQQVLKGEAKEFLSCWCSPLYKS